VARSARCMTFSLENSFGFGEHHTTWPGYSSNAIILAHDRYPQLYRDRDFRR
jgi:hypothetical protein